MSLMHILAYAKAFSFVFFTIACVLSNDQKTIKDLRQAFSHPMNHQDNPYGLQLMEANLITHAATGEHASRGKTYG